jgi:nucleotide-binding universal stress UspA family protein
MTTIHRVLCPVDFSDASRRALDYAAAISQWYNARLTLLSVFVTSSVIDVPPRRLSEDERARLTGALQQLREHVPAGVVTDLVTAEASEAHEGIAAQAFGRQSDLLVMGTHGRSGFRRCVIGSTTERVLREPPCPTLVVPSHATAAAAESVVPFHRIVCGVDFSGGAGAALRFALSLAERTDAELLVLNVIEVPPELRAPPTAADVDIIRAAAEAERRQRLRALIPAEARKLCTVETVVAEGAVDHVLLQACEARQADAIVMGVTHHRGLDRLVFGSAAARVTRAATCPVFLIPETARASAPR